MSAGTRVLSEGANSADDIQNAFGVTKFTSDTNYIHFIAGLIIQGGVEGAVGAGATVTVSLNVAVEKQILGIFCQPKSGNTDGWFIQAITLSSFDLVNGSTGVRDFYWWAIGV